MGSKKWSAPSHFLRRREPCSSDVCQGITVWYSQIEALLPRLSVSKQSVFMTDTRTRDQRRKIMQAVRTRDTGPEKTVGTLLRNMGYRCMSHAKDLPGSPDFVFRSRSCVIFVHGCFWHLHRCHLGRPPRSNLGFWEPKLHKNRERDTRVARKLRTLGWRVMTIWQCQLDNSSRLQQRIKAFLN